MPSGKYCRLMSLRGARSAFSAPCEILTSYWPPSCAHSPVSSPNEGFAPDDPDSLDDASLPLPQCLVEAELNLALSFSWLLFLLSLSLSLLDISFPLRRCG